VREKGKEALVKKKKINLISTSKRGRAFHLLGLKEMDPQANLFEVKRRQIPTKRGILSTGWGERKRSSDSFRFAKRKKKAH